MSSSEAGRAAGDTIRWRSAPQAELRWAELDGDYVVYHRPSGKTHLLNAASAELIRRILLSPTEAAAAADALAECQSMQSDREFTAHVAGLIERLEQLGLVERV